jgi:hypothetical protein
MQDATVGSQDTPTAGCSLQEAAALLGIGINTLRRKIAVGQIRAEQVERPQGYVWRVYLDGQQPPSDPTVHPADQEATGSLPQPPTALAQAEALASLIQATLTPIIGPLVGELAASRQTVERQAETIADLREERGRQTAELERVHAEIHALTASAASETAQSTPRSPGTFLRAWARLDWLVVALVAAAVVAGVLLAVRR